MDTKDLDQFAIDNDLYAEFVGKNPINLEGKTLDYFNTWGFLESITSDGHFDWERGNPWDEWSSIAARQLSDLEKEILGDYAEQYAKFCLSRFNEQ